MVNNMGWRWVISAVVAALLVVPIQTVVGQEPSRQEKEALLAMVKASAVGMMDGVEVFHPDGSVDDFLVAVGSGPIRGGSATTARRIAQTKARREAVVFLRGAIVKSRSQIITEIKDDREREEYIERITERAQGMIAEMRTLGSWVSDDRKTVYVAMFRPHLM